jgi:hypothetical protein
VNPTKEKFELAAKFAGINLGTITRVPPVLRWEDDLNNGDTCPVLWTPHIPSTDAYSLLSAVFKWAHDSHNARAKENLGAAVQDGFIQAMASGSAEQLAEATFLLAVEIGRSMT